MVFLAIVAGPGFFLAQGCLPRRLLGRPDEALGGGNQGPSAPGWARLSSCGASIRFLTRYDGELMLLLLLSRFSRVRLCATP